MTSKKNDSKRKTKKEKNKVSNEKTHIICILDRSGSMGYNNLIFDAINGFNYFLEEQKKLNNDASITVVLFDDKYELIYDNVDIKEAKKIDSYIWYPRGMTALFDAIGKTIMTVKDNYNNTKKPDKVLVCIVTDGEENSSVEYTIEMIRNLIKECEKDNWTFVYLGANQDAFTVGTNLKINGGNTFTYTYSSSGINNMFATLNTAVSNYRAMSVNDDNYDTVRRNLIRTNNVKNNEEDNKQ